MNVGSFIREQRKARRISLRQLAKAVHINAAYLSRVERSLVPASEALVAAVAGILGGQREELLLLSGRLPDDWQQVIAAAPAQTTEVLRTALVERSTASASSTLSPVLERGAPAAAAPAVPSRASQCVIESPTFPFERLSAIAELESWRKEINRPIYHVHKWWAQRLGSVFRAILLATLTPVSDGADILDLFYQPMRRTEAVIFDPFMGSGTTIGEARKLGARAIGRDINPVATFLVRNALAVHSRHAVIEAYHAIECDVGERIRHYYRARVPNGNGAVCDVLYYFWVKVVACPTCKRDVDLFSSRIFAQHAYPKRVPQAQATCPQCGAVQVCRYDDTQVACYACLRVFNPQQGPARGTNAICPHCDHVFPIVAAVRAAGGPPRHRLYAKLVLLPDGTKRYLAADDADHDLYVETAAALRAQVDAYPIVPITSGYNTDQVLNYGYILWHQMFNDRQLLCLSLLAERIRAIPDRAVRELFICLFSGMLEFQNMFASYKGEGTGAVRHMFSHHILKPERTPLEANIWGTPKSSGAFSTLFESRLLRALDYAEDPFELRIVSTPDGKVIGEKAYGLSHPLGDDIADSFEAFQRGSPLYLSCGDSSATDLPPESVDAVVTDPPFFDNVHYSQLADFFYVWQRHLLTSAASEGPHQLEGQETTSEVEVRTVGSSHHAGRLPVPASTRSPAEVQQSDPEKFTQRLAAVWAECHRVIKPGGLLVFTYHHSRLEGWRCVLKALERADFIIVAAHPIKAEMSVATPKSQAKEPIDLDVILVCRKRGEWHAPAPAVRRTKLVYAAEQDAAAQVARLRGVGRVLSRNDVRVVLMAHVIKRLSWCARLGDSLTLLDGDHGSVERAIDRLYRQTVLPGLATGHRAVGDGAAAPASPGADTSTNGAS